MAKPRAEAMAGIVLHRPHFSGGAECVGNALCRALVIGGEGDETIGDTLQLGQLADLSTLVITTPANVGGGMSGYVTLDDGTILNFSEIENIICFTPGTRIATPSGARMVEGLKIGDYVVTRDHGLQPIRWIGKRTVPALNRFAPVRIRPGVLSGLETDLLVSPQHRMLFQGYRAELLFGESEVLDEFENKVLRVWWVGQQHKRIGGKRHACCQTSSKHHRA